MDSLLSAFFTFCFVMMATFRLAKTPFEAWGGFALAVFGALAMVFGQSFALWMLAAGAVGVAWIRGVAISPQRRFFSPPKKGKRSPPSGQASVLDALREGWQEGWRGRHTTQALVVRDALTPTEAHRSLVSDSQRMNPFRPEGPQGMRPLADGARLSSSMGPTDATHGPDPQQGAASSLPDKALDTTTALPQPTSDKGALASEAQG